MAAEPNQKKVVVNFQSVANAPKLRQSKFKIGGNEKFAKVIEFLRCQIHQDTVVRLYFIWSGSVEPTCLGNLLINLSVFCHSFST
ncbi:hypothetical protein BRADI_1g46420v3 [Brachypodium distachyon]|uniref:Ubiquitin-like protein ATG12 n=1 Tax=Brachypodium distachyon TaxID=15368 RepID=A0A0Q3K3U6_BRADI|nr:hypothetical protein BRADI_1g46420v3 [Brachypodium distachyon]